MFRWILLAMHQESALVFTVSWVGPADVANPCDDKVRYAAAATPRHGTGSCLLFVFRGPVRRVVVLTVDAHSVAVSGDTHDQVSSFPLAYTFPSSPTYRSTLPNALLSSVR